MALQSVKGREAVQKMLKLAQDCKLRGDEFKDKVNEEKLREAQLINQQGLAAQFEYIISIWGAGDDAVAKGMDAIRERMLDYAPRGMLCQCTECRTTDFRCECVKHAEGYVCKKCHDKMAFKS